MNEVIVKNTHNIDANYYSFMYAKVIDPMEKADNNKRRSSARDKYHFSLEKSNETYNKFCSIFGEYIFANPDSNSITIYNKIKGEYFEYNLKDAFKIEMSIEDAIKTRNRLYNEVSDYVKNGLGLYSNEIIHCIASETVK